jgi:formate dehydrogenase alpha subunit
MMSINVVINENPYSFEEPLTVLEACKKVGITVPTLCYHPVVKSIGACRICVVEAEGFRGLQTACTLMLSDGMKIKTHSPRIEASRKTNIGLLLSRHPNACMTCEANGKCRLQELVYEYDVEKPAFGIKLRGLKPDDSSLFISRDMNKCIQCQLCVRVCDEIENMSIYSMVRRGYESLPEPPFRIPLGDSACVSCGQCASICPVGAIIEKPWIGKARWWELKPVKTTCAYCGVGCQLDLYYNPRNNEIVKAMPAEENPEVNDGIASCVKGKFGFEFANHPDRLKYPLIKKNGVFVVSTWDEALNYTAMRMRDIITAYGPDAFGFLGSARCTNEENYLLQKLSRAVVKTNNVDHCARLCHASTVAGLAMSFGSGAMTNNLIDILRADVILLTGSNPTENHPVYGSRIKRAIRQNGTKLIVADPRKIELVQYAAFWLNQKPGTDVALFNGLLQIIVAENLIDESFISRHTENWEELKTSLKLFDPDTVSEITGVPVNQLYQAAVLFGKAENAAVVYAMGITQHVCGTYNVIALANLAMATGNIGRPGVGVNPLRGQSNVQGACDVGVLPNVYTGYQKVTDPVIQEKFEGLWKVRNLPNRAGLTVTEMIGHPAIKAMFIMGENPVITDPDSEHVEKSLASLEFFVDSDIFLNETNAFADVILPAASAYEKEGTFTNTERRVQKIRKVIEPIGGSRPDWWIIQEIAKRLGYDMHYENSEQIMNEIRSCTPIYAGISYTKIDKSGVQWPCRTDKDPGTSILHTERFAHPDGKGKFIPMTYEEPPELPDRNYPFYLSTGRILYHYHSGTMTRRVRAIHEKEPEVKIEINPKDAKALGVSTGDWVCLTSRRGRIEGKAVLTERSVPGLVFVPFHFSEARTNALTSADFLDPIAKIPSFKVSTVKIEKIIR